MVVVVVMAVCSSRCFWILKSTADAFRNADKLSGHTQQIIIGTMVHRLGLRSSVTLA